MKKGDLSNFLRKFRLMHLTDRLRYYIQNLQNHGANSAFKLEHPEVRLPPDYLIYESFRLDYHKYYFGGKETAEWIKEQFGRFTTLSDKKILDWGCGPGRIIRHLPEVINNNCEFFGTDYNPASIEWCSANLPGIHFYNNSLNAQLPFPENTMDLIFGISIFTHLSENCIWNG
ncbi:MAG: hypothetical protein Kow0027_03880 [Saprospiraceae bacterium]